MASTKFIGTGTVARTCNVIAQTVSRWARLGQVVGQQLPSGTWRVLVYAEGPRRGWPVDPTSPEAAAALAA